MPAADTVLTNGTLIVGIAPEFGGSWTRFAVRRGSLTVDIFRPSTRQGCSWREVLGASCFPLVPYCGRLREGRFAFNGRGYEYPLNASPERHSSHGDGWMLPWKLLECDATSARMALSRACTSTISYTCEQSIRINASTVRVDLTIRNDGSELTPFGLGLHPYFANRNLAVVTARLPRRWRWDHELMPLEDIPNVLQSRMERGLPAGELPVAGEFAGWTGSARIDWPALGVSVSMGTRPRMRHVVVWAPPNATFFCFEPTSHATDAHHAYPSHTAMEGLMLLSPGQSASQAFEFQVLLRP